MKKQFLTLFTLLVAGLLICACSSSDDVVDVADVATTVDAGNAYVKVTLNTGNSSVTRATDTYDEGTEAERAISSTQSIFLFYDESGNYITYGTIVSDEDDSEDSSDDSSSDSSEDSSTDYTEYATIVLGAYNVTPTQMLAVLNIGSQDSIDQYKGLTLTEMLTKIAYDTPEYSESSDDDSSDDTDYFVMSNALRYSGGALTYGLTIDEDAIYESEEKAEEGSTSHEIYVEREVAKVKISSSYSSTSTDDDGNTTTNSLNNSRGFYTGASSSEVSTATVTVDLDGFAVNAINTQGYIVKQYDDSWTSLSGWYDATTSSSNRFLWAQDANYDYTSSDGITISASTDNGTTTYTTTGTGVFKGLKFLSYSEAAKAGASASTAYYHENTAPYDAQEAFNGGGEEACVPTILAVGHITLNVTATNDVSAGTYNLSSLSDDDKTVFTDGNVYMSNSSFFTLNAVKEFIVKDLGSSYVWIKGTLSGTTVTASDGETAIALDAGDLTLTFEEVALDNTGRIKVASVTLASSPTNATTTTSSAPATRADDDPQYYLVSVGTDDDGSTTYTAVAAAGSTVSSTGTDGFIAAINKTSLIVTGTDSDGNTTGGLFCFTGGKLYYQAPIEHLEASSDIDYSSNTDVSSSNPYTYKGLVRNHYYIIDITAITGLGWPVYNVDEPLVIIPGTEKEYYINCTINVLDWYKHDTQEVTF